MDQLFGLWEGLEHVILRVVVSWVVLWRGVRSCLRVC
jgi:hypothetical protein